MKDADDASGLSAVVDAIAACGKASQTFTEFRPVTASAGILGKQ